MPDLTGNRAVGSLFALAALLASPIAEARWERHYINGAAELEKAIRHCDDVPCVDAAILRACGHWERAEREARDLRIREPLMAIDAACFSLKTELDQGIRLNWHFWVDDMTKAGDEISRLMNGGI